MNKYKVSFHGFAYVEADTPEEAREAAEDGREDYMEREYDDPVEVEEFFVEV